MVNIYARIILPGNETLKLSLRKGSRGLYFSSLYS
jgi:hypothetical protein